MYKIEITAGTLAELAGKVLSLAAQLHETAPEAPRYAGPLTDGSVVEAEKPKAKAVRKKAEPEVAEEAPSPEPVTAAAETVSSQAATATAQPQPNESSETAKNTDASSASSGSAEPTLDFDKDVAPVVIETVSRVGREGVSSTLAEFGAERASEVDPSQYGELVKALEAL